ncbi:MAG: hypothetical protein AVDCRST_MAG78-522, partial [uncultured Rubrobacteraceae bacterium]
DHDAGRRPRLEPPARLQPRLPALRRRCLRHPAPQETLASFRKEHDPAPVRETSGVALEPPGRFHGRPDRHHPHHRGELRGGLGDRAAHQPRRRAALGPDPHPGPPRYPRGQRRRLPRLLDKRLQRLPRHRPHLGSRGSLRPPDRRRGDTRGFVAPRRTLLPGLHPRRCRRSHASGGTLVKGRGPARRVGRALDRARRRAL